MQLFLLITGLMIWPASTSGDSIDQGKIQAAYIYNFINFTTWPDSYSANTGEFMNICLYGEDEITHELSRLNGERIQGKAINTNACHAETSLQDCHVLYISPAEHRRYEHILELISGKPILSVGNDERLLKSGGIISLTQIEGRQRFNVNMRALKRSKLYLSSKLLALAIIKED